GLGLQVGVEAFGAAFAADAGLLEAAEGVLGVDDHAVDGDAARAHAARQPIAALRIGREDGAGEAVGGGVGLGDGVVLVGGGEDSDHGTEDLLPRDLHVGPSIREHGGLDVVALGEALGSPAATGDLRALGPAGGDVALHARELARHRQRAHVG